MCEKMRKGLHGSLHFSFILWPCFRRYFFSGTSLFSLLSSSQNHFFSLRFSEFEFLNRRSSTEKLLQLQIGKWWRRRPTRYSPKLVLLMLLFSLLATLSGTKFSFFPPFLLLKIFAVLDDFFCDLNSIIV